MVVSTLLPVALALTLPAATARAVELPDGFSETAIGTGIQNPVGMEIGPDGRLFVLAGNVRRIEIFDDSGFLNEFIRLPQASNRGSGLLGLELAPDFATSGDVYIAYITDPDTVPGPQRFRLSRFSSDGTVAASTSEVVIFEVEDVDPDQQQHQGGDLVIGADGKIYWALGDRVKGSVVSQPLDSLFGKVLRLELDGTIPTDNPFYADLEGDLRAIYANGLRNPFRMDQRKADGGIFMSEVGPQDWEELNRVEAGANYGWPLVSGVVNDPAYTDPAHAYAHDPDGCAITGGTFYEPLVDQFPAEYHDKYFYGDHCFGWIAHIDLDTGTDVRFLTGADRLVEVKVSPVTGALYYLDREYGGDTTSRSGGIGRIDYVGGDIPLTISRQPSSVVAAVGEDVSFNVLVTGESPFAFQWLKDGAPLDGETGSSLTLNDVQFSDDLGEYAVQITDAIGAFEQSETATLTISINTAPVPVITEPDTDLLYIAGEEYPFAGIAADAEDGDLGASAFDWRIEFHHDEHTHPFIPEALDITNGTFVPPTNDETEANVWYRIYLKVTDSAGTSSTVSQDVFPLISEVTVETVPPGLALLVDGSPSNAPLGFDGVAGVVRVLEAPATQVIDGQTWTFSSWSNDGDRTQTLSTPLIDTTYVATYERGDEDLPPVAGMMSPATGSTESTPVTISGVASDEVGISRVQLTIRHLGTSNHWNGSSFQSGWRTVDADLVNPDSPSTPWSYTFSPPNDVEVKVVAQARQVDGASGRKESLKVSLIANDDPPTEPAIEITSPEHKSTQTNPVRIEGTAELADLDVVWLVIKQMGATNYWNGTDWQSTRTRVSASLSGEQWSYDLVQPIPNNVMVRAIAKGGNGARVASERVRIDID